MNSSVCRVCSANEFCPVSGFHLSFPSNARTGRVTFPFSSENAFLRVLDTRYASGGDVVYYYNMGSLGCHQHGIEVPRISSDAVLYTLMFDYFISSNSTMLPLFGSVTGSSVSTPLVVDRSSSFSGSWGFYGGCDALTIRVSVSVAVSGISLGKWISGSTTADVAIYVIRGSSTSGAVLANRQLTSVQLNTGSIVPLMFEQPVQLEPSTDYTLALRMVGNMVHERMSNGLTLIDTGKTIVEYRDCHHQRTVA